MYSKHVCKRAQSVLCSLLVYHGLIIPFSKSEHHRTLHFCFLGLGAVDRSLYLPFDKLLEIQQLHLLLADTACYSEPDHVFWARPIFVSMGMHKSGDCVVTFRVTY